jgi:putative endonuclease
MKYFVYILRSIKDGKKYREHNSGKTRSTRSWLPFEVIYSESYDSINEARMREKYFKTSTGRKFLKTLIK